MSVPTITRVTPRSGWTGGGSLVEIEGTGFKLPPAPPPNPTTPVPKPAPSMVVTFGGVPATRVKVVSPTLLRCIHPRGSPDRWAFVYASGKVTPAPGPTAEAPDGAVVQQTAFGTVDVTVANYQPNGAPVPGESATAEKAFTFRRPRLDRAGVWLRVLDAFLEDLSLATVENVVFAPNVDYDEDGRPAALVGMATGPGIGLVNLRFPSSKDQTQRGPTEVAGDNDTTFLRRAPVWSDMVGALVIVAESDEELFSLMEAVTVYFRVNEGLLMQRDPAGGDHGTILFRYVTDPDGPQVRGRIGRTNTMTASLTVQVRGIPLDSVPGIEPEALPGEPGWLGHEGIVGVRRRVRVITVTAGKKKP